MAHRRFEQRLWRRFAVFLLQIFFQRSGVYADADRDVFITGAINNRANTLFAADITWVNAQAIHAIFRDFQGNTVVKVDISDQRNTNLLFDKFECLCSIHSRH
ncbi:hypothetical protein D3C87_1837700 [compost metagenome]